MTLRDIEKATILEALKACQWHRDNAAFKLGITSRTLARKIARYRDEGTPIPSWRDRRSIVRHETDNLSERVP
jgi:DNA-binding NtrC family response regulator